LYEKGKFEVDKEGVYTVQIDLKKSIEYYLKARTMNIPRASNNLGVLYINNKNMADSNHNSKMNMEDNCSENIEKGMKYLEEAKQLGFTQAFYNIGYIYESGVLGQRNVQ
jgi:TPR repeat protein